MEALASTEAEAGAVVAVVIAVGTLYCFLGYRTLRFIIGLTGFLVAGGVAGILAHWVVEGNLVVIGICALIGGISGAFALTFLYKTGIFFVGALGGGLAAHAILQVRPEPWIPLVVVGIGLVAGLLAILIERPVMMLATAAIGAWLVISGVSYFLEGSVDLGQFGFAPATAERSSALIGGWAVLTIAGVLAQFATRKKAKKD